MSLGDIYLNLGDIDEAPEKELNDNQLGIIFKQG